MKGNTPCLSWASSLRMLDESTRDVTLSFWNTFRKW